MDGETPFAVIEDPVTAIPLLVITKNILEVDLRYAVSVIYEQLFWVEPDYYLATVVRFVRRGNQVLLLEDSTGLAVPTALPRLRVIGSFPVAVESSEALAVDFLAGLDLAVLDASYAYASDELCGDDDTCSPGSTSAVVAQVIEDSYLEEVLNLGERIVLTQVASVRGTFTTRSIPTMVLKHDFSPYRPSESFEPCPSNRQREVGFFETAPRFGENAGWGEVEFNVLKWDHTRPITFSISANTPAELLEPIEEGILYWNFVFAREVLHVERLDDPSITALDPQHNVIQWIDAELPYAYAMFQGDARSGEILHGGVFLPDWRNYLVSEYEAYSLAEARPSATDNRVRGGGMVAADPVQFFFPTNAAAGEGWLADSYRALVAHEVGHVLGLRHNFAANLGANIPPEDFAGEVQHYYATGEVTPGHYAASSVMDYQDLEQGMLGRTIASEALPYDIKAIRWAYDAVPLSDLPTIPFCSDTLEYYSLYQDCLAFDAGPDPLLFRRDYDVLQARHTLAYALASEFWAITSTPVEQLRIDPDYYLAGLTEAFGDESGGILAALEPERRFVAIEQHWPSEVNRYELSALNRDSITTETEQYVLARIKRAGGLAELVFDYLRPSPEDERYPALVVELREAFEQFLASEDFELAPEDLATVLQRAAGFFDLLAKEYYQILIKSLEQRQDLFAFWIGKQPLAFTADVSAIQDLLAELTSAVLLSTQNEASVAELGRDTSDDAVTITYTPAFFAPGTRRSMLRLLEASYLDPDWSVALEDELRPPLLQRFDLHKEEVYLAVDRLAAQGLLPAEVDTSSDRAESGVIAAPVLALLPEPLRRWFEAELSILADLEVL
ncbi:MAG: hypothetical protein A2284_11640 [Deltaproteobacteria bacterium RIFOXYA12_FULL_61_11]|nr:MAG: hypothetical protein A2284_11640 [Deltaproteobacteria bacterium RIFOXYA12_FULL_61_11]